jgi:hypothetical protein
MRRKTRRNIFLRKKYSRGRDFLLLVLLLSVSLVLFYYFVYRPVFYKETFQSKPLKAIYKVEEKTGGKVQYSVQRVWYTGSGTFIERATDENIVHYVIDADGYFVKNGGKTYRLERALNPFGYPFSPLMGKFILEHLKDFYRAGARKDVVYLGRRAVYVEFTDPFSLKRKFKFTIDKESGLPLFIEVLEAGESIYWAKATFFSELLAGSKSPFSIAKEKAEDLYESRRYDAGEIQSAVTFSIYPPGWIPPELDRFAILKLKEFRLPLSGLLLKGDLVCFAYYGEDRFVQIFQFKGSLPVKKMAKAFDFQAKKRKFKLATLPGSYVAWTKDGNVTLLIVGNIEKDKIIKIAEGLFE